MAPAPGYAPGRWAWLLALALAACTTQSDPVFFWQDVDGGVARGVLEPQPMNVVEADKEILVRFPIPKPRATALSISYETRAREAHSDCQHADYAFASGSLSVDADADSLVIPVTIHDDELAEVDESFEVVVTSPPEFAGWTTVVTIIDDDRGGIVDASEFGFLADDGADQSAALQAALDSAAELGRGVVVLGPGTYLVSSVALAPGTSLWGPGSTLQRPGMSPEQPVTLRVDYSGEETPPPSLIASLTVNGTRDSQGPFENDELNAAHLIAVQGDPSAPGRAALVIEDTRLEEGTASGVQVGPNADVSLCRVEAHNVFREAVGVLGGNSRLVVQGLVASATRGTSGLWLSAWPEGYAGSLQQEVLLEDVQLQSGDFEAELEPDSSLVAQRLEMSAPPFRLEAAGAQVTVSDSTIVIGVPSERHNFLSGSSGMTFRRTTFVGSELIDETAQEEEADRRYGLLTLRSAAETDLDSRLVLEACEFRLDDSTDPADEVFALDVPAGHPGVELAECSLDPGLAGWFLTACPQCESD